MNQEKIFYDEIIQLFSSPFNVHDFDHIISHTHVSSIADSLSLFNKEQRAKFYQYIDVDILLEVFEYLEDRYYYLKECPIEKKVYIVNHADIEDTIKYINTLEGKDKKLLFKQIKPEIKQKIRQYNDYDDEVIGKYMTTNFISIPLTLSINEAMKELVRQAPSQPHIATLYVVDNESHYYGTIELKDLIIARSTDTLESIIMTQYPYVLDYHTIDDTLEDIKDYKEDSIPVLDKEHHLVGVITYQDVIEINEDELSEDYAKLGGLSDQEDLDERTIDSIKKRLPWLILLLGLGIIVSSVVGIFEHVVEHVAIVVCFQSLVLDMAGNVGTQSLAVTIRVLMDEDVSFKDKRRLIFKEGKIGLMNGLILGSIALVFITLYIFLFKNQPIHVAFVVSICTGIALVVAMCLSSISGTIIPILFNHFNIDPAVASGPLITTVNDLVAVVTYYGLAWILLINILGM